jgi:hypothetical protein
VAGEQTFDSDEVSEEDFGALINAAFHLDWSWMKRGVCNNWAAGQDPPRPTPWQVASGEPPIDGIPCDRLVNLALLYCAGCKAQYDCARFAVEGRMIAGTWSMRIGDLKWLQRLKGNEGLALIAEAEATHVAVAVHVQMAHDAREAA